MPKLASRIQTGMGSPTSVRTQSWQKTGSVNAPKAKSANSPQAPKAKGFTQSPQSVKTTSWQKPGSKDYAVLDGEKVRTSGGDGEWTEWMEYDQELQALTITFKDGFVKQYVHVTPEMAVAAYRGVQTSTMNPQRNNSTGAWLHQNLIGQFRP